MRCSSFIQCREVTSHFFLTCRCLWIETSTTALWLVTAWVFSLWMRAAISSSQAQIGSETTKHKASLGHVGVEETVEGGGGEEGRSRKEVGRRSCGGDPQGARAGQRVGEGTEPGEVSRGRLKTNTILHEPKLYFIIWVRIHVSSPNCNIGSLMGHKHYRCSLKMCSCFPAPGCVSLMPEVCGCCDEPV